jgi:hypothetical protein
MTQMKYYNGMKILLFMSIILPTFSIIEKESVIFVVRLIKFDEYIHPACLL